MTSERAMIHRPADESQNREALDRTFNPGRHRADVELDEAPIARCCGNCFECPTCGNPVRAQ